jgi:hypothetical protein
MKLEGLNTAAKRVGLEELPGEVNYVVGKDSQQWRADILT